MDDGAELTDLTPEVVLPTEDVETTSGVRPVSFRPVIHSMAGLMVRLGLGKSKNCNCQKYNLDWKGFFLIFALAEA